MANRPQSAKPASKRLRLRSSHRTGFSLRVSHRRSDAWTPPDKDADRKPPRRR